MMRINFVTRLFAASLFLGSPAALLLIGCNGERKGGNLQSRVQDNTPTVPDPALDSDPPPTPAERDEAFKRLDKAIQAHGGATKLAGIKAVVQKMHGFRGPVAEQVEVDQTIYFEFPDRLRYESTEINSKVNIALAVNGQTGWRIGPMGTFDLLPSQIVDVFTELYVQQLAIVLPRKDEGTTLRPLPEKAVNGKQALGIRVKQRNRPPANLFFDAQSGMLVELLVLLNEAGVPTLRDITFREYKPFDGIMLPTLISEQRNLALYLEWTSVSYQFLDHLDEQLLKKPMGN